jgi:hypothetical protein
MSNDQGQLDFLGQILVQLQKPIDDHGKYFKTPSETKEAIFPITCLIRGRVLDTEVALAILRLPQNRGGEAQLTKILSAFNITTSFED